ncbi:MAG: glutathione S-transferase N-terminal domain-containing protein [Thermoleophilia bacterium]|jgi:glutathione S-transferase|nr:glutathione S-transferase N-terminal domain-containing protein [Thermoleophilia bacterium]
MLTLYQVEWCPHCHRVRKVLTELGLTYIAVNVAARQEERADVVALTGAPAVPVLQDGERVVAPSGEIIDYLRATYPEPEDAGDHRARGAYRNAVHTSLAPQAAAGRLRELLEEQDFAVLAEVPGAAISARLPGGYLLLYAAAPTAAALAVAADPGTPTAVTIPFAITPEEDGSLVAAPDPVGPVWVYGEPRLLKPLAALRERIAKVFAGF